jgi:hypothetical protein
MLMNWFNKAISLDGLGLIFVKPIDHLKILCWELSSVLVQEIAIPFVRENTKESP